MSINKRLSKPATGLSRKTRLALIGSLLTFAMVMMAVAGRDAHASLQGAKRPTPGGTLRDSSGQSQAQSIDKIWQFIDEAAINSSGIRQIVPQSYRTVRVDEAALKELLGQAPFEFTSEARRNPLAFTMPMPDGSFSTFHVEESPVMEAPLAAQYPELKTYRGQGIDDPTATTRFDITPNGFHAIILSEHGTIYIDPYAKGDTANYICYFKSDYRNDAQQFACYFNEDDQSPQEIGRASCRERV